MKRDGGCQGLGFDVPVLQRPGASVPPAPGGIDDVRAASPQAVGAAQCH